MGWELLLGVRATATGSVAHTQHPPKQVPLPSLPLAVGGTGGETGTLLEKMIRRLLVCWYWGPIRDWRSSVPSFSTLSFPFFLMILGLFPHVLHNKER